MKPLMQLVLPQAILHITLLISVKALASFQQPCSQDITCDPNKFLTCSTTGQCECLRPNSMTFELSSEKCVTLAGQKCVYELGEGSRNRKQAYPCVPHADCDKYSSGICLCSTNYFKAPNDTCVPTRDVGETCQLSEECHPISSTCHQGTCTCDPVNSAEVLDETGARRCKKKVGVSCRLEESDCVLGSSCTNGYCRCDTRDYFATPERTCETRRRWNQSCTDNSQCSEKDKFWCSQEKNTCQCEGDYAVHPETKICKLKVDLYADSLQQQEEEQCVPNAVYRKSPTSGSHRCYCNEQSKFVARLNDYCYIKEGEACDGDQNTFSAKMCLPGLACRNKRCTCPFKGQQAYNEMLEKCKSYVAGPCDNTTDCYDVNAECVRHGPQESLRCHCKTGYLEGGQRCEIPFGGKCDQGENSAWCDSMVPLECSARGICECPELHVYNEGRQRQMCSGLEGSKCGKDSINRGVCIEGATCKPVPGPDRTTGICVCRTGMTLLENRTCARV